MGKRKKKSAVIELLDLVYANANSATTHSWGRINHGMRAALSLAIGSGFEFADGDFAHIGGNYKSGYWVGDSVEWMYGEAVVVGNMSACKDFESWKGREAFIADQVEPADMYGPYVHGSGRRDKERLHVGASFPWKEKPVTVTSFADDQSYLTACSYKPDPKVGFTRYIDKRFKITRDDIIADRKERKAALAARAEARKKEVEALAV